MTRGTLLEGRVGRMSRQSPCTIWFMNGSTTTSSAYITGVTDTRWKIVAAGDYDGDGKADILWRHSKTGDNQIWLMNGGVSKSATQIPTLKDSNWTVVKP